MNEDIEISSGTFIPFIKEGVNLDSLILKYYDFLHLMKTNSSSFHPFSKCSICQCDNLTCCHCYTNHCKCSVNFCNTCKLNTKCNCVCIKCGKIGCSCYCRKCLEKVNKDLCKPVLYVNVLDYVISKMVRRNLSVCS
jgi:hypothetical protein